MINYVNLIPLLLKNKGNKKEDYSDYDDSMLIQEAMELDEQIPRDLAQAYKDTSWERGYGTRNATVADAIASRYGENQYVPDHDFNVGRRAMKWDLGNATYERITKQQAVDLLGMVIKEGEKRGRTWINEHEISIDDPVPQGDRLHVTFANSGNAGAIQNIDKLRFLLPGNNGKYALTEFSYKATYDKQGSKTNNYIPIFRQQFDPKLYTEYNIPPFAKGPRIDWRKNDVTYDATMVYYAIKLSEVIYKTDEYEHPIDPIPYTNANDIIGALHGCINAKVAYDTVEELFKNILENNAEALTEALDILNRIKPKILNSADINSNSSAKNLWKAFEDNDATNFFDRDNMSEYAKYSSNSAQEEITELAKYLISTVYNQHTTNDWPEEDTVWEQFEKYYEPQLVKTVDYNNSIDLDKQAYYIQDKLIDSLPDSRSKEIWSRRVKNSRKIKYKHYTPGETIDPTEHTANDIFKSRETETSQSSIPDTGSHEKNLWTGYRWGESYWDKLIKQYNAINRDIKESKDKYIKHSTLYRKTKSEADYYDDQDYYSQLLQQRKNSYETAKWDYIDNLNEKRDIEKKIYNFCDNEASKTVDYMEKFYSYIEYNHKRLLDLRNIVKEISNYTPDQLTSLYGNKGREKLAEIENSIKELVRRQEELTSLIEEKRTQIENLRQQIAQLEQDITSATDTMNDNSTTIATLHQEQSQFKDDINTAIENSYADQDRFRKTLVDLTQMITNSKLANASRKQVADNKHVLELMNDLNSDIINIKELATSQDPDEEDILSDDDQPANSVEVAKN